jgi:gluconolactonase
MTYPMLDGTKIGNPVQIANTFTLAEGPLWDPCQHRLLFVDVQGGGGGGTIHSLAADGQISVFMMNTNNTNGIAFDIDGSLILAQMGGNPGHVARRDKAGMVKVIDQGSMLHTPDDVVVRSDGTIYFTDGDFPPISTSIIGAFSQLPVYAIKPGTSTLVNGGNVGGPNGIELSPDEKTLYVDAYAEGLVYKYSVADDGTPTKGTAIPGSLTNPDSLCLDAAGNLYVGVSTGLHVMRPDGTAIKDIPVGTATTNCTFGGDDGKTLYITAWKLLLKVEGMPIPGLDWVNNTKRLKCN